MDKATQGSQTTGIERRYRQDERFIGIVRWIEMNVLKRNMETNEAIKTANDNIDEYLPSCQASFNSDGNITWRNFNVRF